MNERENKLFTRQGFIKEFRVLASWSIGLHNQEITQIYASGYYFHVCVYGLVLS